jgi:chromosome partitioning protein
MRLAICGIKGGVGKSTVAVGLAAEGMARGLKVLLVDGDAQGTARTWAEVATEQGHPVPAVVSMGPTMHQPGQLDRVGAGFDLVVIDCPPRAGDVQRSALMACDLAILPCGPSASDTWAVATSTEIVIEAQAVRPALRAAILVTKRQGRTALGRVVRDALRDTMLPILETELFYRIAYQEALAAGLGVGAYAPSTPAAFEIRRLFNEVTHAQDTAKHQAKKATIRRRNGG